MSLSIRNGASLAAVYRSFTCAATALLLVACGDIAGPARNATPDLAPVTFEARSRESRHYRDRVTFRERSLCCAEPERKRWHSVEKEQDHKTLLPRLTPTFNRTRPALERLALTAAPVHQQDWPSRLLLPGKAVATTSTGSTTGFGAKQSSPTSPTRRSLRTTSRSASRDCSFRREEPLTESAG